MSELLSTGNSISKCFIISAHWELDNREMISYLSINYRLQENILIEITEETLKEIDLKN